MNVKVDCLLELWGAEVARKRYESALASPLAALIENGALVRSGGAGSKCLAQVGRYVVLSKASEAIERHLTAMFEEAPRGVGGGRASSLYRLARARYALAPRLAVTEQCRLLAISSSTYKNWLAALHDYLSSALENDVSMRDLWLSLDRLSEIKIAS